MPEAKRGLIHVRVVVSLYREEHAERYAQRHRNCERDRDTRDTTALCSSPRTWPLAGEHSSTSMFAVRGSRSITLALLGGAEVGISKISSRPAHDDYPGKLLPKSNVPDRRLEIAPKSGCYRNPEHPAATEP